MNPCPDDGVLRRFVDDALPDSEARTIERHLDGCSHCRRRLDTLADVTAVGSALAQAAQRDPTPSPGLARAIERLEEEVTSWGPSKDSRPVPALPALPATNRPGFIGRLGHIEIQRVIGRGGMGVVYEGLDPALDRKVAVKVLSPHLVGDGEAKERFLREARAAAALMDDHVVTIHAIDETDGMPFLVLQHVAGESLGDRLARQGRLPIETVARIGAQVARGLAAAHARGLVHRDVKPANILIEQGTGLARLTDFGLAKLIGRTSITGRHTLAGTPGYMSPEQAAGKEIDARSDLFSLGVVLYAAAGGRPPFGGDSPFVILDQIRTRTPKPLAQVDPALPTWFCSAVDRLLEKDPAKRIQTAAEVVDLLEQRTPRKTQRSTAALWLTGVGAAAAIIVGLVIYRSRSDTSGPSAGPELNKEAPAPRAAAVIAPGYVIVGRPDHFATLADAVKVASYGDTIEIHGNGPHRERRLEITGKKLVVRAAAGYRPRIQPDAPGRRAEAQWLGSNTELTIEGLDILWPVSAPKGVIDKNDPPATLGGSGNQLTLRNCRVVCGSGSACIWTGVRDLTIDRCHLVPEEGPAIWWGSQPGGKLRVSGSVLEGGAALWISFQQPNSAKPSPATIEFVDNTVTSGGFCMFVYRAVPKQSVDVVARRNVFSIKHLFGMPTQLFSADEALPHFRTVVTRWTEADNVYDKKGTYLAAVRLNPTDVYPTTITELRDWQQLWKADNTGSIEGTVRFHPRGKGDLPEPLRFERVEGATGRTPATAGAGELPFK